MHLTTSGEILSKIWKALNQPAPRRQRVGDKFWALVAREGWTLRVNFEDQFLVIDPRLYHCGLRPSDFTAMLDLPWRLVFHRPNSRFDEPMGFEGLAAEDAASTLILLERLGFSVNPSGLCSLLRPTLQTSPYATESGLSALFHHKSSGHTAPLTISVNEQASVVHTITRIKTDTGYRAEFATTSTGAGLYLTVHAPRYRRRPDPQLTTCPECGATYVHGLPSDDAVHRRMHRDVLAVLQPPAHRIFARALQADPIGAPWVDSRSPQWKHNLMYTRAVAFKREMKFDFPQWAQRPADDPRPIGFLFNDGDRVIGACSFRPPESTHDRWKMDWIWLCPSGRRKGFLGRAWPLFKARFGDFALEQPVSPAMQAFVAKVGGLESR